MAMWDKQTNIMDVEGMPNNFDNNNAIVSISSFDGDSNMLNG